MSEEHVKNMQILMFLRLHTVSTGFVHFRISSDSVSTKARIKPCRCTG